MKYKTLFELSTNYKIQQIRAARGATLKTTKTTNYKISEISEISKFLQFCRFLWILLIWCDFGVRGAEIGLVEQKKKVVAEKFLKFPFFVVCSLQKRLCTVK